MALDATVYCPFQFIREITKDTLRISSHVVCTTHVVTTPLSTCRCLLTYVDAVLLLFRKPSPFGDEIFFSDNVAGGYTVAIAMAT